MAEAKKPGTWGVVGRGVCPATAKGRSRSIRIAGVFCSTARGAGTVDDRGKGEGVAGQPPEVAAVENFLLMIFRTNWSEIS